MAVQFFLFIYRLACDEYIPNTYINNRNVCGYLVFLKLINRVIIVQMYHLISKYYATYRSVIWCDQYKHDHSATTSSTLGIYVTFVSSCNFVTEFFKHLNITPIESEFSELTNSIGSGFKVYLVNSTLEAFTHVIYFWLITRISNIFTYFLPLSIHYNPALFLSSEYIRNISSELQVPHCEYFHMGYVLL